MILGMAELSRIAFMKTVQSRRPHLNRNFRSFGSEIGDGGDTM
jgi:hypothetical protein